jgi:pteridine reductase
LSFESGHGKSTLHGKRALVTGAGTRLGQAIAIGLGAEGVHVAVHYHTSADGAKQTASSIELRGGRAHLLSADLSCREQARHLVDDAVAALGGLDLLVVSAGNFENVGLNQVDDTNWDRTMNLNLAAPVAMVQRAAPCLRQRHGSIVFITCASVVNPFRGYLPYMVAKAGLYQLMRALALELAPEVRVNAVAPGLVLPANGMQPEQVERIAGQLPLHRAGSPDDVVSAVIYLATSTFVTGQQLVIDGGLALGRSLA